MVISRSHILTSLLGTIIFPIEEKREQKSLNKEWLDSFFFLAMNITPTNFRSANQQNLDLLEITSYMVLALR